MLARGWGATFPYARTFACARIIPASGLCPISTNRLLSDLKFLCNGDPVSKLEETFPTSNPDFLHHSSPYFDALPAFDVVSHFYHHPRSPPFPQRRGVSLGRGHRVAFRRPTGSVQAAGTEPDLKTSEWTFSMMINFTTCLLISKQPQYLRFFIV